MSMENSYENKINQAELVKKETSILTMRLIRYWQATGGKKC